VVLVWSNIIAAASFAGVWFYSPLLANPFEVMAKMEHGVIDDNTLLLMAVMLPIL